MSGLRMARELHGLSQSELGRRMKAAGFNWTQMTVSRREEHPLTLRWHEGVALRKIIGYPSANSDLEEVYDSLAYREILAIVSRREWGSVPLRELDPHEGGES